MPNLASSLKTIIAEQLDVSVESVCLFPGSLPSLVKQLMQMKVTDTAMLKEHLKLDKAGIPSLTAALLEVCISRHPFLVRDCLIDGGWQRFDINITDEDTDRFVTSKLHFIPC
jgi:hypothetical protein